MRESLDDKVLLTRFDRAWRAKNRSWGLYEQAYSLVQPNRNLLSFGSPGAIDAEGQEGERLDRLVVDSQAERSAGKLASRIKSVLCPKGIEFLKLEPGSGLSGSEEVDMDAVTAFLESLTKACFSAIETSNFHLSISECFQDLVIGTGALIVSSDANEPSGIRFSCPAFSTFAFDEDQSGRVDGVFRMHKMPVRLILGYWPDAVIPSDADPESKEDAILCEAYARNRDTGLVDLRVYYSGTGMNSMPGTGNFDLSRAPIFETSYKRHPWAIVRWSKLAGETEGRGPSIHGLGDIQTLNATKRLLLEAADLAIDPVMQVDNSVYALNPEISEIRPGQTVRVARSDAIQPLQWGGRPELAQFELEDLRRSVREHFVDKGLPDEQRSEAMTAQEVIERVKELQGDVSSPFERIMHELLVPVFERIFEVLEDAGRAPNASSSIRIDGVTVNARPVSGLAQAQSANELEAVMNWIQLLQTLDPTGSSMLNVDLSKVARWSARKLGVDPSLLRDPQEAEQLMAMISAQAQQMSAELDKSSG